MGTLWKVAAGFGTLALAAFGIYAQGGPEAWYGDPSLAVSITAFVLFAIFGLMYLVLLVKERLNPLDILDDDWQCTYWPVEKQLRVTLCFLDHSGVSRFSTSCLARFGQQEVKLNRVQALPHFLPRGNKEIVEFSQNGVEVALPKEAAIEVRLKPDGVWATKSRIKVIPVAVVSR